MRAWELLLESEEDKFDSDLNDLIVASKANGLTEIDVDNLVDQLVAMGHSVTPDSLVNSLEKSKKDHKNIKNVTLNTITLKSHTLDDEDVEGFEDHQVDAERVATKAALKSVKSKNQATRDAVGDQL